MASGKAPRARSVAVIILGSMTCCSAQYLPVYGGPMYAPSGGGYIAEEAAGVAADGSGVGWSDRYVGSVNVGSRPVRWGPSLGGASELAILGTDNSGYTVADARAVNAAGIAVGRAQEYVGGVLVRERSVRWDIHTNSISPLGFMGPDNGGYMSSIPYGINASGMAVGQAAKFNGQNQQIGWRAVRWDSSGVATELGNLGTDATGMTLAGAFAVNASGTSVGGATKYSATFVNLGERAVRWDASGTDATELLNPWAGPNGNSDDFAYALNDAGTAVGWATRYLPGGQPVKSAIRWDASTNSPTVLGNLGAGGPGNVFDGTGYAINVAGTVVGAAGKYDLSGSYKGARPVRWDPSGTQATELGNLGTDPAGNSDGQATAINTAGDVVGTDQKFDAFGNDLRYRAVYWPANGTDVVDLNTLIDPASGWLLTSAWAISDTGWIAGVGDFDPDGPGGQAAYARQFVLQVPESATASFELALTLVLGLRRGRRSSSSTSPATAKSAASSPSTADKEADRSCDDAS